jgi:hypothetical protein
MLTFKSISGDFTDIINRGPPPGITVACALIHLVYIHHVSTANLYFHQQVLLSTLWRTGTRTVLTYDVDNAYNTASLVVALLLAQEKISTTHQARVFRYSILRVGAPASLLDDSVRSPLQSSFLPSVWKWTAVCLVVVFNACWKCFVENEHISLLPLIETVFL